MITDAARTVETKALRLAQYLREFVGLRSTTVRDINGYEAVLWFGDMPQEPHCHSPAWEDGGTPEQAWLTVRKQQFRPIPAPPEIILPWIDQQALRSAAVETPLLRETALLPDSDPARDGDEERPLVEHRLDEHPQVRVEYDRYRPVWESWSTEYRRQERIQSIYAELFRLYTQVQKQGELVELVLGLGLLAWNSRLNGKSIPILRHAVTARVELHFEPATALIRVECAADGAQLRIEDDMLEAELRPDRGQYASVAEQLNEIGDEVWDRQRMFAALKSWTGALHEHAQWSDELRPTIGRPDEPMLSFAPALILRKRTQAGMARIYDAIIDRMKSSLEEIPAGWRGLISDEDDAEEDEPALKLNPEANTQGTDAASGEIYFPLPANREQRRIVEIIDQRRGVLVQGPPGTGKSHTIANLVCHLLASGKRVLITAETGHALRVLKDKLPKELQPLCVSLLGQGGDSFAELNAAVEGITSRFAAWSPGAHDQRIAEIKRELDAKRRLQAELDGELRTLREDETTLHVLMDGSYQGTASKIAERIAAEREHFGWLRLVRASNEQPPTTDAEMVEWLRICRTYDDNARWTSRLTIVDSDELPLPIDFGQAVVTEREAKEAVERLADLRTHAAYQPIIDLNEAERLALGTAFDSLRDKRRALERHQHAWLGDVLRAALGGRQALWQALVEGSRELVAQIGKLSDNFDSLSVTFPTVKEPIAVRADAATALEHLRSGGKWKVLGVLTPSAISKCVYLRTEVNVNGRPAETEERLQVVCDYLDTTFALDKLEKLWEICGGLPVASQLRIRLPAIKEHIDSLADALAYAKACRDQAQSLAAARPSIPEPDWVSDEIQKWLDIINASIVEKKRRAAAERVTMGLRTLRTTRDLHDAHPVIGALINAIERRDVAAYSEAYEALREAQRTKLDLERLQRTEETLNAAVSGLVETMKVSRADPAWTDRLANWENAWRWAIADNWLQKRTDYSYQQSLWSKRHTSEKVIQELLGEAAALRAWTHFFNRLSAPQAAALKSWREAVKQMGKGTGRSAKLARLRREARQYMNQCREAIPIWVMPRYLVAEMVDPAPGRYDTVIVDEASQLGIESLFLFYIAKKMIVVGDDQQISPYGIGIGDDAIVGLQQHYLDGIPHHHALSAQSSLYANAKIRFGHSIVLREHFRCMPEIIQFSNDLCYAVNGTPLDPLRAYPVNRLSPLVVRHVPDGYRTGSAQNALNEPEADALVAQVVACIRDPRYEGRTMGVISLQGDAQARLIENKLMGLLEPEIIEERRLICGDAYAFQGDERQIMFLSMVAAPNERIGALAADSARQRFNVAASRAQDQMWLFHSATIDVLSPSCMRYRLLKYMLSPDRQPSPGELVRFESELEHRIFDLIVQRGYHVRTQVCVGDPTNHRYRIDLVVEGMQGRLAVECDGDEWHGPERYEQDMARQRDLERAGWHFVRIRGGDFFRGHTKALEPLWAELERFGIRPGGIDQNAAEPPEPDSQRVTDTHEKIRATASAERGQPNQSNTPKQDEENIDDNEANAGETEPPLFVATRYPEVQQAPYVAYRGPALDDPRTVNVGVVAKGLCQIIDVEGPMVAKRAYHIYLRSCGIKRMGRELKSTMNKALASAIRQGAVVSENESGKGGLLYSVVRPKGRSSVNVRSRGPRTFDEIPPSELQAVSSRIAKLKNLEVGTDEHLRAVLECYDLRRLTAQVGTSLLEILARELGHAGELFANDLV